MDKRDGVLFFFFSSRRRHTRFDCDWSSDVCSSDLEPRQGVGCAHDALETAPGRILKRFFLKSLCHVLHPFVEATVTWTVLKSTRDRGGGPPLPSEMDDALGIGLAEPRRSIKRDAHFFVG